MHYYKGSIDIRHVSLTSFHFEVYSSLYCYFINTRSFYLFYNFTDICNVQRADISRENTLVSAID